MPLAGYLSITIYAILFAFCTFSSRVAQRQAAECGQLSENPRAKMPLWLIFAYALLFTLYNVYCTETGAALGYDRSNYAYDFVHFGARNALSVGLEAIFNIVLLFGGTIETVFYLSTFLCCALTFYAYRLSDAASAPVIPLLLCSEFVFFTFTALKQCYACAFASLFFVLMMRKRTAANTLAALLMMVLACLFHTVGYVLIPLFFLLLSREKRDISFLIIGAALIAIVFFLPQIALLLEAITSPIIPSLAAKIRAYFGALAVTSGNEASPFSFLKWIPFYFITAYGFFRRRELQPQIPNYDAYLVISCVASAAALCSFTSYWFYRFLYMFFLPVFIFYNQMAEKSDDRRGPDIVVYGGLGFLLLRFLVQVYVYYGGF